jgi:hypothetical protein
VGAAIFLTQAINESLYVLLRYYEGKEDRDIFMSFKIPNNLPNNISDQECHCLFLSQSDR